MGDLKGRCDWFSITDVQTPRLPWNAPVPLCESTSSNRWADEWMEVMAKRPELALDRVAMRRLFAAAMQAGYSAGLNERDYDSRDW